MGQHSTCDTSVAITNLVTGAEAGPRSPSSIEMRPWRGGMMARRMSSCRLIPACELVRCQWAMQELRLPVLSVPVDRITSVVQGAFRLPLPRSLEPRASLSGERRGSTHSPPTSFAVPLFRRTAPPFRNVLRIKVHADCDFGGCWLFHGNNDGELKSNGCVLRIEDCRKTTRCLSADQTEATCVRWELGNSIEVGR